MSKKLIAGAGVVASFAVALAPLATFATDVNPANYTSDAHTDTFNVTVEATCAFGFAGVGDQYTGAITGISHSGGNNVTHGTAHAAGTLGTATWTPGDTENTGRTPDMAGGTAHEGTDTAAYHMYAGMKKDDFASTAFTVVCNNTDGWIVKATAAPLKHSTWSEQNQIQIAANASYTENESGYAISNIVKTGSLEGFSVASTSSAKIAPSDTMIAQNTGVSAASGDTYTVTYGIGVAPSQATGLYTGNVVYSLYQGVND